MRNKKEIKGKKKMSGAAEVIETVINVFPFKMKQYRTELRKHLEGSGIYDKKQDCIKIPMVDNPDYMKRDNNNHVKSYVEKIKRPIVVLQVMLCGDSSYIAEIMWKEDFEQEMKDKMKTMINEMLKGQTSKTRRAKEYERQ